MTKGQQIKEMTLILDSGCNDVPEEICVNYSCSNCKATLIYERGYRKQSEGEWIENKKVCSSPYCSNCGTIGDKGNYCSHCGAYMKGGDE